MKPDHAGPAISIIIPVLREEHRIQQVIERIFIARTRGKQASRRCGSQTETDFSPYLEILIVDGCPQKSTIESLSGAALSGSGGGPFPVPVRLLSAPPGRGIQMNHGARSAAGELLLFLHADTQLPETALDDIREHFRRFPLAAGAFSLGINSPRPCYRVIETAANIRSRLGLPYGDQAIFLSRDLFFRVGGYPDIPIMEDLELMRRLKKNRAPVRILPERVRTSARRWEREGVFRATLRNWMLAGLYIAGGSPERLARFYPAA